MKKIILSTIAIAMLSSSVFAENGKIFKINPLSSAFKAKDNGGNLDAIDAYQDGVGVLVIGDNTTVINNGAMNTLVFKYGEAAKKTGVNLADQVLFLSDSDKDKMLAELIKSNQPDGQACNDNNNETFNDKMVNGVCVGEQKVAISFDNIPNILETNIGIMNAAFVIKLDKAATSRVSVDYQTTGITATAGIDFTSVSGTATFEVGETSKTIFVPVFGDTNVESDETYTFVLSNQSANATIATTTATASIRNDDVVAPKITATNGSLTEGNSGYKNGVFTVVLDKQCGENVSVQYTITGITATNFVDFEGSGIQLLHFAAGETTKSVSAKIYGDTTVEPNETFKITLSNPTGCNATIGTAVGTFTILNDD